MKKINLFCITYAGGSASVYVKWKDFLNPMINLRPVELAGRGSRFKHPFYHSISDAVEDIFRMIEPDCQQQDYALYGHSMGCVIVYELVYKILKLKCQPPLHVFFSGRYPPFMEKKEKKLHNLPDDEFISELKKFNGITQEVIENKELLEIILTICRNDYRILENYKSVSREKLNIDLSIMHGKYDESINISDLDEWQKATQKSCRIFQFSGGHFFIRDCMSEVVNIVNQNLLPYLSKSLDLK